LAPRLPSCRKKSPAARRQAGHDDIELLLVGVAAERVE
jgi:hypothetical protein